MWVTKMGEDKVFLSRWSLGGNFVPCVWVCVCLVGSQVEAEYSRWIHYKEKEEFLNIGVLKVSL